MPKKSIPVKVKDDIIGGVYTNNMVVSHSREEFVMDFLYINPQQGSLNARVISSPAHMKRIVRALADNIAKYEAQFGAIPEVPATEIGTGMDLN